MGMMEDVVEIRESEIAADSDAIELGISASTTEYRFI